MNPMLGLFHYQILCEVLERVHLLKTQDEIAAFVLEKVSQALNSEGGTIFLIEPDGQFLTPRAAYGAPIEALQKFKFPMGQGVVGWVAKSREPVYVEDVRKDPRFFDSIDAQTGFSTSSIVAAPILFGAKVEGVLEFLNKKEGKFNEADLELIAILGREVGAAIEKAVLDEAAQKATTLEWAFSHLGAGVVIADPHHRVIMANPRAKEILGTPTFAISEGDRLDKLENAWPDLAYSAKKVMETSLPIRRQQTSFYPQRIVGFSCVPLTDHEGTVAGAALLLQDITPNASSRNN
ncbi:MAG: GAF domain-containing protein [Elusimicrobia bacterium]|nr:GAF domain-containing protein [Elusimicrobiota bacterium]